MAPAKPSLELLRSLSDEHVLRALMRSRRATRAEIAAVTGLSKPTISESVKRLVTAGAVADTGERTTGRGRVGTYYALPPSSGVALVASLAPEGIVTETLDVYGDVVARSSVPAETAAAEGTLRALAGSFRLAVVSAADPVDRATGRLVALPDAPFLLGELDPRALLGGGDVTVDNDVNWAARAELAQRPERDFAYLWLGEGLGCAIVGDGAVIRGSAGVAGEIAHLVTTGPGGTAMRLTDVFAALGLRRPGSTAIDVPALLARPLDPLAIAVAGVVSALVALADPAVVLLGGPWGPAILEAVRAVPTPRTVRLEAATVTEEPALAGARAAALERLRDAVIADARRVAPAH